LLETTESENAKSPMVIEATPYGDFVGIGYNDGYMRMFKASTLVKHPIDFTCNPNEKIAGLSLGFLPVGLIGIGYQSGWACNMYLNGTIRVYQALSIYPLIAGIVYPEQLRYFLYYNLGTLGGTFQVIDLTLFTSLSNILTPYPISAVKN
jgi:hypothetical protein